MKARAVALALALVATAVLGGGCTAADTPFETYKDVDTIVPSNASVPQTNTVIPSIVATEDVRFYKPVIYLYSPEKASVVVRLNVDGEITLADPPLDSGGAWRVSADPSGVLIDDASGRRYPYLFWEADGRVAFDMSSGSVVEGPATRRFLRGALARLGLSESEAAAFIEYWAPRMEGSAYKHGVVERTRCRSRLSAGSRRRGLLRPHGGSCPAGGCAASMVSRA